MVAKPKDESPLADGIGLAEKLHPLKDAPALLEPYLKRKLHPATMTRWAKFGVSGIKLKTVRIGRSLWVSESALAEFIKTLSLKSDVR